MLNGSLLNYAEALSILGCELEVFNQLEASTCFVLPK